MAASINSSAKSLGTYLLLLVTVFCIALDISIMGPLFTVLGREFSVPISSLSQVISLFVFFGLLSAPIMTVLADTKGRKIVFIAIIILFAISTFAVGYSGSLQQLLIARAFQGFASGGIFPISVSIIQTELNPKRRGLLLGLLGAAFGIAFLVGPIIAGILVENDWRLIFKAQAVIILIISGLLFLTLKSIRTDTQYAVSWRQILYFLSAVSSFFLFLLICQRLLLSFSFLYLSLAAIMAATSLVIIFLFKRLLKQQLNTEFFFSYLILPSTMPIILVALIAGAYESSLIFLPSMVAKSLSLNPREASFIMIPLVVSMIIGTGLWGHLLDRRDPIKVINVGLFFSSIFIAFMALAAGHMFLFITFGCLLGISMSAFIGTPLRFLLMQIYPENLSSSIQGLLSFLQGSGRLVGATIFGGLITFYQDEFFGYQACLVICSLLSLISLKYFYKNRDYLAKEAVK
jgi:MFS family permease